MFACNCNVLVLNDDEGPQQSQSRHCPSTNPHSQAGSFPVAAVQTKIALRGSAGHIVRNCQRSDSHHLCQRLSRHLCMGTGLRGMLRICLIRNSRSSMNCSSSVRSSRKCDRNAKSFSRFIMRIFCTAIDLCGLATNTLNT